MGHGNIFVFITLFGKKMLSSPSMQISTNVGRGLPKPVFFVLWGVPPWGFATNNLELLITANRNCYSILENGTLFSIENCLNMIFYETAYLIF